MGKKNQIPKYPHLRFPEFTDEWKEVKLGEVLSFEVGYPFSSDAFNEEGNGVRLIKNRDLKADDRVVFYGGEYDAQYIVQNGDILIGMDGDFSPCLWKKGKALLNQRVGRVNANQNTSRVFILYVLVDSLKKIEHKTSSTTVKHLSHKDVEKIKASLPSLAEQKKIAALLSLIDERIEVQNAISNDLESLIVGFYNSVQYVTKAGWHKVRLRDLLTIREEQNTSGSYEVYSVSVSRGIVNQIVHLGRSFAAANTSNYGVVHPGDLVYTKSPTGQFPFGIVKQNHNASPVAVSPLYGVYRPISPEVGTLLHYFFLSPLRANNYLAPLIQKGAKNTINIRTDHFLDNVVLLPKDEKELRCIADCLLALDERLSVEREYAEQLKQQKAYLLRQIFI